MKRLTVADVFSAIFVLALVTILVRPTSLAPKFLQDFGTALDNLVHFAVAG